MVLAGCGSKTGTVSGKVTYQGQPVPGGIINFLPQSEPDRGKVFSSGIDANGIYQVVRVPVGPVKITVQDPGGQSAKRIVDPNEAPRKKYPTRYATPEGSDLTFTVAGGSQEHDIELK
jgi:hypothetical protein